MDVAFLCILEKKDFAYITVKEICAAAGVNRSTFYLHYETIGDLLAESADYITGQFVDYMKRDTEVFINKINTCPIDELYLVTPKYLTPYLNYIKEHRRLFLTAVKNAAVLRLEDSYSGLFRHVLSPIMERFGVPEQEHEYRMAFYINGFMAIITEWIKNDCKDSDEHIISIMQSCAGRREVK